MDLRPFLFIAIVFALIAFVALTLPKTSTELVSATNVFLEATTQSETITENQSIEISAFARGAKTITFFYNGKNESFECTQNECTKNFSVEFEEKGIYFVEVFAVNGTQSVKKRVTIRVVEGSRTCIDSTLFGACSSQLPFFCDNGALVQKCSECGCREGFLCLNDSCVHKPVALEVVGLKEGKVFSLPLQKVSFTIVFEAAKEPVLSGAGFRVVGRLLSLSESIEVQKDFVSKNLNVLDTQEVQLEFSGVESTGEYSLEVELLGEFPFKKSFEGALIVVEADEESPMAPVWSNYFAEGAGIKLNWLANSEEDVKEYRVFESTEENPAFIAYSFRESVPASENFIVIDSGFTGKQFFLLKAVDWLSNESGYSEVLEVES